MMVHTSPSIGKRDLMIARGGSQGESFESSNDSFGNEEREEVAVVEATEGHEPHEELEGPRWAKESRLHRKQRCEAAVVDATMVRVVEGEDDGDGFGGGGETGSEEDEGRGAATIRWALRDGPTMVRVLEMREETVVVRGERRREWRE
ncbi:hypothetical protein Syun_017789 [Stephania yunnanensis]|uniref:Uncharacterized protein n=1 Tax=Stephania yunnanensis TaxID=152371 RepID=A0AAP0P2R4_9MAGN